MESYDHNIVDDDNEAVTTTKPSAMSDGVDMSMAGGVSGSPEDDAAVFVSTRTYDLHITYDNYYRTPRLWRGVRTVRVEQPAPFFDLRLGERAAFADVEVTDETLATALRRRRFKVRAAADDAEAGS